MSAARVMLAPDSSMSLPPSAYDLPAWTLDPDLTTVAFSARHLGAPWVDGEFTHVTGKLHMQRGEPLTASCWGEVDARRLVPGRPRFNTQVRTSDFLDPERHPKITFAGRLTDQTGERAFRADAEITIRGWTQQLSMDVDYLGERQTPYRVGDQHRGDLTRVTLKAQARITRDDLAAALQDKPADERVVVASAFHITVMICAILDADLHATGAIEQLGAASLAAPPA
jgi:polyisoprenoid-binding protein YceI